MAAIRAQERGTEAFWTERIELYLSGEHSPQKALSARTAFVAVEGMDVVGFAAGHRTTRFGCDGELQWINVAEKRRGRGIADRLIASMGVWFVQQEASRICVNVDPHNLAARKLYARCGAQLLNEHWMVWENARSMTLGKTSMKGEALSTQVLLRGQPFTKSS